MLPSAQILAPPTALADCKQQDISSTARSLISSSFLFLQVDSDLAKEQRMADRGRSVRRGSNAREELWFSLPSNESREQEWARPRTPEPSAYNATSNRHSTHGRPPVPSILTTTTANKPLPPSPEPEKKKRGTPSIRSLIRRRPSGHLDSSHLQPEPVQQHQRSSSANGNLLSTPSPYHPPLQFSRSMPSSPAGYSQNINLPVEFARSQSAMAESTNAGGLQIYQSYQPARAVSMNTYFDSAQPRSRRTFPDSGTPSSATPRDSASDRPRPHTWLSPTEPFEDASDFHLFAQATAGLPPGALDMDIMSPNDRPQLQGSLFARGRQNDVIPLPMQYSASSHTTSPITSRTTPHTTPHMTSQSHQTESWQSLAHEYMAPPPSEYAISQFSSSALPRPDSFHQSQLTMNMNGVNLELERLGIEDNEGGPDDELPNYAQSQAEMSAKRRAEATTRARELEARWNSSRGGWRGR